MLICRLVCVITASDAHVEEASVENLLCLTSACVCCDGAYICWQCADFHAAGSVLFAEHVRDCNVQVLRREAFSRSILRAGDFVGEGGAGGIPELRMPRLSRDQLLSTGR